jgi:hypothetical protein
MGFYFGTQEVSSIVNATENEVGKTVWAYYNGSDIETGKKVLLTRTNNAMATDDEFMNGAIPLLINNGLAYCGNTSDSNVITTVRNIIDGVISDESVAMVNKGSWYAPCLMVYALRSGWGASYYHNGFTWVQSMAGGNSAFNTFSSTSNIAPSDLRIYGYTLTTNNELQFGGWVQNGSGAFSNGSYRISCTENYVVWRDRYTLKVGDGLDKKQNALSAATDIGDNSGCFCFERKNEDGKYLYAICYKAKNDWYFRRFDYETKTTIDSRNGDIECPHYDFSIYDGSYGPIGVYVQTKDYKYLLGAEFYLQLDYKQGFEGEPTGIVAKRYPEAITSVLGDRFIGAVQTFYDNTFALTLNDGSTLMCRYDGTIPPEALMDNDLLAHCCQVEEIAPYTKPNDENIYYRHFSSDKAYWFTSITRNYNESESFIGSEAYPYNAEDFTNSYLALEYNKERFNSTVLTGFMTGESKIEDGRQLVGVRTVTE